jgi:hypothetical protein
MMQEVSNSNIGWTSNTTSGSTPKQQSSICFAFHNQLPKPSETTNGDGLLFCSDQRLEHYNNNKDQNLDLSLIPEEVIDDIVM